MSEKRYKVESYFAKDKRWSNLAFVVDNEKADKADCCFLGLNDVVALLNQLWDENEQLRKEHQEMLEKYLLLKLKMGEVLNDE